VVVATNTPINDLVAVHTKQAPYLTYVIGARVPRGSVTRALYWDTLDPYHYVRLQAMPLESGGREGQEVLIVGGEDHKSGQDTAGDRFERLATWARERVPQAAEEVNGPADEGAAPEPEEHDEAPRGRSRREPVADDEISFPKGEGSGPDDGGREAEAGEGRSRRRSGARASAEEGREPEAGEEGD
jgi:hypothetical protein